MDISWYELQVPSDPSGAPWLNDVRWQAMLCAILSQCDERLKRQISGLLSLCLERGGQQKLADITGLCSQTVGRGRKEIMGEMPQPKEGCVRKVGAGRKKKEEVDPKVQAVLLDIVEAHKAGDPTKVDVWAGRSLSKLQKELKKRGHGASKNTIRRILKKTTFRSLEIEKASLDLPTQTGTSSSIT